MSEGREPGRRITLADVACEAGVSVQTASHVLSGNLTVRLPENTRAKVREAAEKVGYHPNRLAQAMKRGKTRMISVWMPLDRPVPNYMRFLQAINAKARANEYDLMILGLDRSLALSAKGRPPQLWPVDGVISLDSGKAIELFLQDRSNDSVPVSIFGLEQVANSDSVSWDVAGASRKATERLIGMGCRKIVHVTLDWVLSDFPREQRRRGYTEAMDAAELEPEFIAVATERAHAAEKTISGFLESNPVPDAFTAFTDPLAIGAAKALATRGARTPEDCLIWGYGDYPESEDFGPGISTLKTPVREIVSQAWDWLMQRLDDHEIEPRLKLLPMELVERGSTNRL